MASKQVEALAKRIKDEFGLEADPERFYRTYAGYNEKAHGCATWVIYLKGNAYGLIGGFEPIRKHIVKRNKLDIGRTRFHEFELYVYTPDEWERLEQSRKYTDIND